MSARPGRHASPDNSSFYKSLMIMILGIIGVGAVVFGILYLMADNPTPPSTSPMAGDTTTTTPPDSTSSSLATTTTSVPSTTTVPVRDPSEVRVQVLNSMGLAGAAGRLTTRLANEGYQTIQAADYSPELNPTRVWYRDGFSAEANVLLSFVPDGRVEQLPDPTLSEGADVIIVLGTGYQE